MFALKQCKGYTQLCSIIDSAAIVPTDLVSIIASYARATLTDKVDTLLTIGIVTILLESDPECPANQNHKHPNGIKIQRDIDKVTITCGIYWSSLHTWVWETHGVIYPSIDAFVYALNWGLPKNIVEFFCGICQQRRFNTRLTAAINYHWMR